MELNIEAETVECPSCQGNKTVHWEGEQYPCLLCHGTGKIELEKQARDAATAL